MASNENNNIGNSSIVDEKQIIDSSMSLFIRFKQICCIRCLTFNAKKIIDKDANNLSREMRFTDIRFERSSFFKTFIHVNHPNENINPYN